MKKINNFRFNKSGLDDVLHISNKTSITNPENYQFFFDGVLPLEYREYVQDGFSYTIKNKSNHSGTYDILMKEFKDYKKKISEIVTMFEMSSGSIHINKDKKTSEVFFINGGISKIKNSYFKYERRNFRCQIEVNDNKLCIYQLPSLFQLGVKLPNQLRYEQPDRYEKIYLKNSNKITKVLNTYFKKKNKDYLELNVENGVYQMFELNKSKDFKHLSKSTGICLVLK